MLLTWADSSIVLHRCHSTALISLYRGMFMRVSHLTSVSRSLEFGVAGSAGDCLVCLITSTSGAEASSTFAEDSGGALLGLPVSDGVGDSVPINVTGSLSGGRPVEPSGIEGGAFNSASGAAGAILAGAELRGARRTVPPDPGR